jgi:hypothetical protein
MPVLTSFEGELGVALFTIFFGIVVESRFASKWTILFNVVPLLFLLSSVDLPQTIEYIFVGYSFVSIALAFAVGETLFKRKREAYNNLKQLVGAKGYGALTLAIVLTGQDNVTWGTIALWFFMSLPIYYAWHRLRKHRRII